MFRLLPVALLFSLSVFAQSKTFRFPEGTARNIFFFENINDTIICLREAPDGVEWNLFDTALNPISSNIYKTSVRARLLTQLLKPHGNNLLYVKQRIIQNRFEIGVKPVRLTGEENLDSLKIIYSEPYAGQLPASLNYYSAPSPNYKLLLLYRTQMRRGTDSIRISAIVLSGNNDIEYQKQISIPIKSETEQLLALNIDDNGRLFAIVGEDFNSYVLGTQLNFFIFEKNYDKTRNFQVKIPKRKLQNIIMDNRPDSVILYATAGENNFNKEVDGITEIYFSKKNGAYSVKDYNIETSTLKRIAHLITAPKKTALDQSFWTDLQYRNTRPVLLASVRSTAKFNTPNRRIVRGNAPSDGIGSLDPVQFVAKSMNPEERHRRDYNEMFVMFKKQNDDYTVQPIYANKFGAGIEYPKLAYNYNDQTKVIQTQTAGGNYRLGLTAMVNDQYSNFIIPGTKQFYVDERLAAIGIKGTIYFVAVSGETDEQIIIKVK